MLELKRCKTCGIEKPATPEYFYRDHTLISGLAPHCKECVKIRQRKYNMSERAISWRNNNRERFNEYQREYQREHREEIQERQRQRRIDNPEINREKVRLWRKAHPEYDLKKNRKRRAKQYSLPFNFSDADESFAVEYFYGCCAVCGRPLNDLFGEHSLAMDHWIPLSDPRPDNPGTVAWNMVPLCHGIDGCNNSKFNCDPVEWIERKFGKRKARQIIARIEAYFAEVTR